MNNCVFTQQPKIRNLFNVFIMIRSLLFLTLFLPTLTNAQQFVKKSNNWAVIQSYDPTTTNQQDPIPSLGYRVVPNPVRDQIQLYGPISRFPLVLGFRLYDAQGRIVQRWSETLTIWPRALDVSRFPSGLYVLSIIEKGREDELAHIKLIVL